MKSPKCIALLSLLLMMAVSFPLRAADVEQETQTAVKDPYEQTDLRDIFSKLRRKKKEKQETHKQRKASIFLIPVVGANPSIGTSFGVAFSGVGYRASEEDNVDTVLASLTYSTKNFFIFNIRSDVTFDKKWHLLGDWRYYDYRERTHGFGSDTSKDVYADVDYKWFRFREAGLLPVASQMEIGADYALDMHRDMQVAEYGGISFTDIPESGDSLSSGLGPVFVYDSTDNRINASRGLYVDGRYRFYQEWLGSDQNWQLLDLDARAYFRLPSRKRQLLALWGLSQIVTSGTAPYFDNPANAWDTYGRTTRGYPAGRFRGTGWVYAEAEYRADLMKSGFIGAVAFVSISTFRDDGEDGFNGWVPAGGFGFRFKVDKRTGSNIAIDFGLGKEESRGVYLAFNEAF